LYHFYVISLLVSSIVPVVVSIIYLNINKDFQIKLLTIWFLIRIISDSSSILLKDFYDINIYPFFHISVLLESLVLISFFGSQVNIPSKNKLIIGLIPVLIFVFEAIIFDGMFDVNHFGIMCYNLIVSVLMLNLLIRHDSLRTKIIPIIKAIFFLHAISFIYSIAEGKIRMNIELMPIVYPIFLFSVVIFNLFISLYLWSVRKS
jgi:hypothetical protein